MNVSNLSAAQLRKAADLTEKIEALNAELQQITGESGAVATVAAVVAPTAAPKKRGRPRKVVTAEVIQAPVEKPKRGPKKGGMSAEGRARIAAAQKARWAKAKGLKTAAPATAEKPVKRKMSAAGRARIIAAQKARWAKVKAGKKG